MLHRLLVFVLIVSSFSLWADSSILLDQYRELTAINATKDHLTKAEIEDIYKKTVHHPVTTFDVLPKYDPTGDIGFCFGRAMAVHLLALKKGLSPHQMKKLFIVGDLRQNPERTDWRFHVTTVVKGEENKWYAIDPLFYDIRPSSNPPEVGQWVKVIRNIWDSWNHDSEGKTLALAKLYLTNIEAVTPNILIMWVPESGEELIELNFNLEKYGINSSEELKNTFHLNKKETLYFVDNKQLTRHFLTPESGFDFEKLIMKRREVGSDSCSASVFTFDYNNYFKDLFDSFLNVHNSTLILGTPSPVETKTEDWDLVYTYN